MQRVKGARFERAVACAFRVLFPGAKRGLGQARAANEVPDVDVPGLWPELKAHKLTNPRAALAQAVEATGASGRVPIAVCQDNGGVPFVALRFVDYIGLLARLCAVEAALRDSRDAAEPLPEEVKATVDKAMAELARMLGRAVK